MKVAVLGATGLVGSEMLKVLEKRDFPAEEILPLASLRSAGRRVRFSGCEIPVRAVCDSAFDGVDIALFSAGADASRTWASVAAAKGTVVIDNSSAWRMDPKVPLVVPEVNPEDAESHHGIIANPNCATIQAVTALKPLHDAAGLEAVSVVTFQSVSGTGRRGLDALTGGTESILEGKDADAGPYPRPIAFDVLPEIGEIGPDGISGEERKMILESRKILHLPDLAVTCTAVRVPVFRGHAEAVTAAFREPLDPQTACRLLDGALGVACCDGSQKGWYVTSREAAGTDDVFVGRVRSGGGGKKELSFWVAADNLRKGAALNAVQIAEIL
ncbi:MAG: aspartate-semialdehyde dehydrogenase [Thermovirgaceae bacterium]